MEDSPEPDRWLKRVKYAQQDDKTIPANIAVASTGATDSIHRPLTTDVPLFESPWRFSSGLTSPSQVLFNLPEDLDCPWGPTFPDYRVDKLTLDEAPQPAGLNLRPATSPQPQPQPPSQVRHPPVLLSSPPADPPELVKAEPQDSERHEAVDGPVVSPFTDSEVRLMVLTAPRYARPESGQVNGYVKFNWPSRQLSRRPSALLVPLQSNNGGENITTNSAQLSTVVHSPDIVTLIGPVPASSVMMSRTVAPKISLTAPSPSAMATNPPISPQEPSLSVMAAGEPRMLPPQFGFQVMMDCTDRRLFEFYTKNWCPGRSVLNDTNLWLRDLAPMHKTEGILYAIQSLAGIYIYDYLPDERIQQRINERYAMANEYFSKLLVAPESRNVGRSDEVITMAVILSMQDIVLTERWLKNPSSPRWLEGFKQGEYFLHKTDPGGRFWKDHNVQYSDLRVSLSIIVGRAVILAQPMMALPSPAMLKPEEEASRFDWLLYGTEKDMFEIHGGCGFSRKLLHTMSQVAYCAARLQQEPESTIVPITARYLHRELQEMRQWSREGISWKVAQAQPPTIVWVRSKSDNTIIDSNQEMTDVTAEAWRIAAIIYLQCRLLRLPRNHPEVLANLTDLAKCIRIMPTSGSHFTAQAPLLPVFFLGMLATLPDHKDVSRDWFEEVVRTPSVPPLYQALKRIWAWIGTDVKIPSAPTALSTSIGKRYPWWENLVASVHVKEKETLCLT
ncbi:fungal-specific transcription factor domain-containing protein [Dactylonectria macrodidyma]|uniref:Fungal-specific transcription factor domain-containing protein n=1 Tax=Dactylonectria macrodidyma TaxID=307937 RepID=A0A9P9E8A1_9HYPO|nr:fungal-specific transcription factor domain-containing protein [Dactylonectria macrodidyma]